MAEKQYIHLDNGLAIYQKDGTPYWFAYIYLKKVKKAKHLSLKTTDVREANTLAFKKKMEAETRLDLGFNPIPKSLAEILVEYHDYVIKKPESKGACVYQYKGKKFQLNETVRREMRFIIDHLVTRSQEIPIDNIRSYHLENLLIKDHEEEQVLAKSTLSARKALFNKFFTYATDRQYLTKYQVPEFPKIKTRIRKIRSSFTDSQVEAINQIMLDMAQWPTQTNPSKVTLDNRWLLYYLFNFNLYLGSRPGREIVNNHYKDVKKYTHKGQTYYAIHIYQGKTENYSPSREMTISRKSEEILEQLTQYTLGCHLDEAREKYPNAVLFARPSDQTVPNFSDLWEQVRKIAVEKGIIESDKQHLYTLYSTRHFFVSNALLKGSDSKLSLAELSQHVGSSAKLIQNTYAHVSSIQSSSKYLDLFDSKSNEENNEPQLNPSGELTVQERFDNVPAELTPETVRAYLDSIEETGEQIIKRIVLDDTSPYELKHAIDYICNLQGYDESLDPYLDIVEQNENEEKQAYFHAIHIAFASLLHFNKIYELDEIENFEQSIKSIIDLYGDDHSEIDIYDQCLIDFFSYSRDLQEFYLWNYNEAMRELDFSDLINLKGHFIQTVISQFEVTDILHLKSLAENESIANVVNHALLFHQEMMHFINDSKVTQKAVFTLLDHYGINTDDLEKIKKLGTQKSYSSLISAYLTDQGFIDKIATYITFGQTSGILQSTQEFEVV